MSPSEVSRSARSIKFVPRWNGPIHGHAINTIRRYLPSLIAWHEFEDLLQEAYIVYMKCSRAYTGKVDTPQWFMSLFSRSLENKLINMVKHGPRYNFIEDSEFAQAALNKTYSDDMAEIRILIQELPREIAGRLWAGTVKPSMQSSRKNRTPLLAAEAVVTSFFKKSLL